MDIITRSDLPQDVQSHELIDMFVDGANAAAQRVAPCLGSDDPEPSDSQLNEARLVLISAVRRWADSTSGAFTQQSAGPFSATIDTRPRSGYKLWPSEIKQLQEICGAGKTGKAFGVDTAPSMIGTHVPWCSLAFGAPWCSCGTDIAGEPIYEREW